MAFADLKRIAVAQINVCVGDIAGNAERIMARIDAARARQADLIVFPEMAVCGYPPEDLLLRPGFHRQMRQAVKRIAAHSRDIKVLLGYTDEADGKLYNACGLLYDGAVAHRYRKRNLPNYGVFDEKRYFTAGGDGDADDNRAVCDIGDARLALSVCEDLWTPEHAAAAASRGARLLININASPYHLGKARLRQRLLRERARDNRLDILYVNMSGGQDELVFDGDSMWMDSRGETVFRAPRFVDEVFLLEMDGGPSRMNIAAASRISDSAAASRGSGAIAHAPDDDEADIYQAVVCGVRDYARKNRFAGAVLGLSGGIDSALTLTVAVDALGAGNVEALIMPSRYTAEISVADARDMAERLGVAYRVIDIEPLFTAFLESLAPAFAGREADAAEENLQARCRGLLLMAISNKSGKLLLTTGNKSELAVGYATLYGDMAGGFAPLKDLSKTRVYQLARWRNKQEAVIPRRVIERPPSAELRAGQKDEDSLPPYEILDAVLERYIELDQSPARIVAAGFEAATVAEVIRLVDRNEYKRRQAAPGVRITARAFGRDRRYPITSLYKEAQEITAP